MNNKASEGFDNLLKIHTAALEENSEGIAVALECLAAKSKGNLSAFQKKELDKIRKQLKLINRDIDGLGG